MKMKKSVKQELVEYIEEALKERELPEYIDELHYELFNTDPYCIGYYESDQWLKRHDITPWEAIEVCQDWEIEVFGELTSVFDNAEKTVSMLMYIWGGEILSEMEELIYKETI